MHKILTGLTLTMALLGSGAATAGNPKPPPADPIVIVDDTRTSSGHILVPLLALIFMIAGASG